MRGSSELIGFLVDVTFGIASTFAIAFLIAFLWDYGWQPNLTIILASLLASAIWSWLVRDNLFVWVLGTIACWALMAVLVRQVSWFGFFN